MNNKNTHFARNLLAAGCITAGLITAGYFYVKHQEQFPNTDDAYVHANIVYIAPQVSGKVITTDATDYATVSKGDLLVQIDPAPYQAKLDEAKAAYEIATSNNAATDDAILAASADVKSAMATLSDAQISYKRIKKLTAKNLLPEQNLDDARQKLSSAENNVTSTRARMSQLIKSQGAKGDASPEVKKAAAALSQASLSLSYTNIFADHDGTLGKVEVHPGSVVVPGQALTPLVEANSYWVQANFKETHVGRVTKGMQATITLDLYPNVKYVGTIEAISPASGASFSLLPPENATGNWVKVPQRFPVRIKLDNDQNKLTFPLRVGASASVTVDTLAPLAK